MRKNIIFAAFFLALFNISTVNAQFSTNQWYGDDWWSFPLPASMDHASPLYRSGSYCTKPSYYTALTNQNLRNRGYLFLSTDVNSWDRYLAPDYGVFLADITRTHLSINNTQNANDMALAVRGFGGLALLSKENGMYVHQNGIVSIGLNPDFEQAAIRTLSQKGVNYGYSASGYQLYVRQGIVTEKIKVATVTNWPDYVFRKDYKLLPLSSVEAHIAANGHLPNIPSAATIEKEGMELGDMVKRQQEKIEELFLHLIEMQKRLEALETENAALKAAHLEPKK